MVSIHAPTRGATHFVVVAPCNHSVSIHAPTRGATCCPESVSPKSEVSIHAPTRGATNLLRAGVPLKTVSIHAPTRGATRHFVACGGSRPCFNPRTHEGCDKALTTRHLILYRCFNPRTHEGCDTGGVFHGRLPPVSIHAPTRGATWNSKQYKDLNKFQSTHPRGVRLIFVCKITIYICFNPRTHEGCDVAILISLKLTSSFNPRTHEGCDNT